MRIEPGPFIMHEHWPEWAGYRERAMREALIILRDRANSNKSADEHIVTVAQCIRNSFTPPLDEGTSMHIARKIAALAAVPSHAPNGNAGEAQVRPLVWNEPHPSHRYPNWAAGHYSVRFEARIDTSKPLMWGQFPLSINGEMIGTKFDTVEQAKAYAQADYEKRIRRILAAALATPAAAPIGNDDAEGAA